MTPASAMYFTPLSYVLGWISAILVGMSKTGVPGVSLPAILLMAEAFSGNEKASAAAILPILLLGDCFGVMYYRQHADWRKLGELLPFAALGMAPGAAFLYLASDLQFKRLLGALILGLLLLEILRQRMRWYAIPHLWWFSAGMGILAGFTTMVGNAAGPTMSIYLVSRGMDKEQFMGTWAWFFLVVNSAKVPIFLGMQYFGADLLSPISWRFELIVLPAVFVGALAGRHTFRFIPQRVFDPLVLALAGAAAVRMLIG
ncbi:MAG: sulfite exporter TauE/SafE family protein [Planctomycetota bacterium]